MHIGRITLGTAIAFLALVASLEGCSSPESISQSIPATPAEIATDRTVLTPAVTETPSAPRWIGLKTGSYLIYSLMDTSSGEGGIADSLFALPVAGGDSQLIASQVTNGWLSPDQKMVVYLEIVDGVSRVLILDRSTGSRSQVEAGNGCLSVDWSPDGTEIACSGEKDIFVFGLNDQTPTLITTWSSVGYEDSWALPVWSPTGNQLAYFNLPNFQTSADDGLYITDLTCRKEPGACRDATIGPFGKFSGMPRPAWAPDGRLLAIADYSTLYVLDTVNRGLSEIARASQDNRLH